MSISPDRLRSRLIGTRHGKKLWAYQCGQDLCDSAVHQGRLIHAKNGKLVWAEASECRWQPWGKCASDQVKFVMLDRWPPFGVTTCISIRLFPGGLMSCSTDPTINPICPEIYLNWDGVDTWSGDWAMDNGTMHIAAQLSSDPDGSHPGYYLWKVTFSNCISPSTTITMLKHCALPMTVVGTGFSIPNACCSNASPSIVVGSFELHGFTERARPARLVITRDGKKVWASSYCCPVDARCTLACCECDASPAEYTFNPGSVADQPVPPNPPHGPCTCVNTLWTLRYIDSSGGGGGCRYQQTIPGCGQWTLSCNNLTQKWLLDFSGGSPPAGIGSAHYSTTFAAWNCLGRNTMSLDSFDAGTCIWPSSIILDPV